MITRNSHPIDNLELMAYLDGELSRETAAAAAAHLEECADCKALAGDLRQVSREMASWQVEVPEAQITARLTVALEDHERAWKQRKIANRAGFGSFFRQRKVWRWAVAGVALVLAIGITVPNLIKSRIAARSVRPAAYSDSAFEGYFTPNKERPSAGGTAGLHRSGAMAGKADAATQAVPTEEVQKHGANVDSILPTGPMIVRTAELALTTTDFDQARTRLEEILRRHKGYLGELNVTGATGAARTLTATLRVPAEQLDATIAEVKNLGHVDSETQNGEEVTQQYVDLQARLLNARNSEQRLTQLLQRTGKLSDVLAVEEQIERVRENIERMEAEKKELTKQVAFSTLNMKVAEDYKERVHVVPDSTSTRLRNAAVEGYAVMVAGLINLLLFLEAWGPSLLLWGAILFFPARWLWRRRRARLL